MKNLAILCFSLCALYGAAAAAAGGIAQGGALCLTFDDRNFDSWERCLPLFEKYGAHATFFVCGAIDSRAQAAMKTLADAGHSVGLHGLRHRKATELVAQLGEEGYLREEILPQLSVCREKGIPVRSFAYPMSARTAATDELLLRHFERLRSGYGTKADGTTWGEAAGPVRSSEVGSRRVIMGMCGTVPRDMPRQIAEMLPSIAAGNLVLTVYAHDIEPGERAHDGHNITESDLENILSAAKAAGVAVIGFDELGATAPCVGVAAPKLDPTLVAIISDTHVNGLPPERLPGKFHQADYLRKTVEDILSLRPLPANVIGLGDYAYLWGMAEDYALVGEILAPLEHAGIRVTLAMGDHDRRDNFLAQWPRYAEDSPVQGRIVSCIDTPHCEFVLLDTVNDDPIGFRETTRPGQIGDAQMKWLEAKLAAAGKPVIVCGHHGPNDRGLNLAKNLFAAPACKAYFHGHWHRWFPSFERTDGRGLLPRYTFPSTGHWGDIGFVLVRTFHDHAVLELHQNDWFAEHGPATGGAVRDAVLRDRAGETATVLF